MPTPDIRILACSNNARGDLFAKLMTDLFLALGYDTPRLSVHKTGRELDLSTVHRFERRRAVAECKATAEPIGGADLNKFVGVLDAEHDDTLSVSGYFVSLSGFTSAAIEQERARQRTPVTLLSGSDVIAALIDSRMLVTVERATELAGRACGLTTSFTLDPYIELLAHERGWIWAVYYTEGKARTHYVLIHADGTPLARAIADQVATTDVDLGGSLSALTCLNQPSTLALDSSAALRAYTEYIASECGDIHLDGLPADSVVGSRRLRLESLFVPLCLTLARINTEPSADRPTDDAPDDNEDTDEADTPRPVGDVLATTPRLALLAPPGGGKSTLIKRLAVAYADARRRTEISDGLPAEDWLPLFFRCRELRDLARAPFGHLLDALAHREPVRQHHLAFRALVDRALLEGRALLLIDGLDEISDIGDRAAFVSTIRTALQAYPSVRCVVTAREAGFRHVAAHLAPTFARGLVSAFTDEDVMRLTVAWHKEVVGDTEKVRTAAESLATSIVNNDRIRRLAINPLLLTTLLLVKRWVGSLPTRRAVLYAKAVEVLLMTWNTEGHDPIPEEEAMPQLCYVAVAMMVAGTQKISRPRLAKLLLGIRPGSCGN